MPSIQSILRRTSRPRGPQCQCGRPAGGRRRAFRRGAGSGLAEPLAAVVSSEVIALNPALYPIGLAIAAMLVLDSSF